MAKKTISIKKIYSICFLGMMVILGVASIFAFVINHLPNNTTEKSEKILSFSELYPFQNNEENTSLNLKIALGYVEDYKNLVNKITDATNQYLTANNPFSSKFKGIQNLSTSDDIVLNGSNAFVKLSNGYLAGFFDYCPSPEIYGNIKDFSTWLGDMDIPYITLITPNKSDDSITVFPEGIPHGYTQTLDEYKTFLNENGLKYIEAKQVLLTENDDFYSWFYKSDHHWNVRAAFVTARKTAKYLSDELNIHTDTNILNDDNFELCVYPDGFLGSYGRKLGDKWKEDMEVLYPTIETDFNIEIPSKGLDKTGEFDNTLIDQKCLETDNISFCAFVYGDYPLINIENNNCKNGTKILVIKFSFANALCPYLANTVQYLDMIDPRYFDGSIRSYIKQTEPDVVILCMGAVTSYDEDYLHLK